jgi:SAM-dependent methyltransferase
MPTSTWSAITPVLQLITELRPAPVRVLDVGIGYGKWGFLCREYLTYWRSVGEHRHITVDGIEVFPEYITGLQREIYDNIMIGDARELLPRLANDSYDLVVMMDVVEHFVSDEGVALIRECKRVARVVLISTPSVFWPQEAIFGNSHERHLSVWSESEFRSLGARYVGRGDNVIAVFGPQALRSHFGLRHRVARWFAWHGPTWVPVGLRPQARWAIDRLSTARQYLRTASRDPVA